eukprot:1481315-Alexandrium_andersonii.AAC.1
MDAWSAVVLGSRACPISATCHTAESCGSMPTWVQASRRSRFPSSPWSHILGSAADITLTRSETS